MEIYVVTDNNILAGVFTSFNKALDKWKECVDDYKQSIRNSDIFELAYDELAGHYATEDNNGNHYVVKVWKRNLNV